VSSTGCGRSQTRTWNVLDACGNAATTVSLTVSWTEDTTPPVIVANGTTLTLGCNPSATAIAAALGSATYTDDCGPITPTALAGEIGRASCRGSGRSQARTGDVLDECGNAGKTGSGTGSWPEETR